MYLVLFFKKHKKVFPSKHNQKWKVKKLYKFSRFFFFVHNTVNPWGFDPLFVISNEKKGK